MTANELRTKYLNFFQKRGHAIIPSAPLVPENDPTTLFTSCGMQPLISYILGQPHPRGKRLVDSQKSFRAQDIEEVGDNRHTTFFEMLGNWSLGDYFKKEQLPWNFEFLTRELGLDPKRLYVSVFEGNQSVEKDTESIALWKEIFSGVGINAKEGERIFAYPASKNWWSRSGEPDKMPPGEPGGPDSEVFYDFGADLHLHEHSPFAASPCHPNCDCGRFLEIANSVFMQYQKQPDGRLKELPAKNVDFGGGLERQIAAVIGDPDVFKSDLFTPLVAIVESLSQKNYGENPEVTRAMRIVVDHVRASIMMMADGVVPSNKAQGYILRRLLRRSLLFGRKLGLAKDLLYIGRLVNPVVEIFEKPYPEVAHKAVEIRSSIEEEARRFEKTLERGLKEIDHVEKVDGAKAFYLYETYGFPWEMTQEIVESRGQTVEKGEFETEFRKHQELSRSASAGMFRGGLADHSEEVVRLHTATHLLHQALRMVLGNHVSQKGSNITPERLRFDFSHSEKLTPEQLGKVEEIVNQKIKEDLPVNMEMLSLDEAKKHEALAFFGEKYGEKVKVYSIGSFSKEVCGGPHVEHTGVLFSFKIIKEESIGQDLRRIKAVVGA